MTPKKKKKCGLKAEQEVSDPSVAPLSLSARVYKLSAAASSHIQWLVATSGLTTTKQFVCFNNFVPMFLISIA